MGDCFSAPEEKSHNDRDLASLQTADKPQKKATYDRLWASYDKDNTNQLDSAKLKPLLIDCVGATIVQLEEEKKNAVQEAKKHKKSAKEATAKAGGGFMAGVMAGAVVSAVADPSEATI
eukprot:TRINITY_DN12327_c0_g1_i2.p2 TRINITY_DN12327_c0_g1~~TRINITY_DN12327_c0_g1_i2.p2  ORF type:complete len:119 (+),score=37.99 TRINITY_DN12327_c0_g1_i2:174-530(+)